MKRYLILGVVAMSALAAVIGYRMGSISLTETEAIQSVASVWVAKGGAVSDCAAVPGQSVWLIVRCANANTAASWQVDKQGRISVLGEGA